MNSLKSIAINISIPLFISVALGSLVLYEQKIPKVIFSIIPYLFYAVTVAILWVSWHFNRNRFIFIVLPLVLIYIGFIYLGGKRATDLFLYVSVLYPLHLLLFLSLRERGLFSIWGVLKIAFFARFFLFLPLQLSYPLPPLGLFLDKKTTKPCYAQIIEL